MPTRSTASTICGPIRCARGRSKSGPTSAPTRSCCSRFRLLLRGRRQRLLQSHLPAPCRSTGRSRPPASPVTPFAQDHGTTPSLGFRFGRHRLRQRRRDAARGGLRGHARGRGADRRCHALPAASDARPSRPARWNGSSGSAQAGFLTNLHVDMDYAELDRLTPAHVQPCHDGLVIDVMENNPLLSDELDRISSSRR